MIVYQMIEYGIDEKIDWGIFSTEEKAKDFLLKQGWLDDEDFLIKPRIVDGRVDV